MTTECDDVWALAFGSGVCEVAHTEAQIALILGHEISHLAARDSQRRWDYRNRLFQQWQSGEGSSLPAQYRAEENTTIQAQIQAEHPELATLHDPAQINAILAPYQQQANERVTQRVWDEFIRQKQPMIDDFARQREAEADVNGMQLMAQAGFQAAGSEQVLDNFRKLRAAVDFNQYAPHPSPEARMAVLRQLAASMPNSSLGY
jgi:predicted Zn-dependent protease